MFSQALRLCLLALGPILVAGAEPGQWVGDLFMVNVKFGIDHVEWVFLDERDDVHRVIPNIEDAADFPGLCRTCSEISMQSYWHGDALYTWANGERLIEGGRAFRNHVLAKWEDGGWRFLGSLRVPDRNLLDVVPCDGGRFIVISSDTDIFDDRRPDRSPFCRVSIQEGKEELRVDSSIDHGQDALRGRMSDPVCFRLPLYGNVIMTEGRATVLNGRTGLYWVFSTETARLVKAGSIFRDITPEMVARGGFESAVLCAHPEKSGTVLVSAQDETLLLAEKEDAFREYTELWYSYPEDARPSDEIEALLYRRLEEIRSRSPLIVWHRIHPENGRVERLPVPPEGGASFREGWTNEFWRPMPDGSVRMGWNPHTDKTKAQAVNWADGAPKDAEGAGLGRSREAQAEGGAAPADGGATEGNGDEPGRDGGADKDKGKDEGTDNGRGGAPAGQGGAAKG
jgi:hypothetical protein